MLKGIVKKSIEFLDRKLFRYPFVAFLISLCFSVYFLIFEKYSIWIKILPFLVLCVLLLICIFFFLWQEVSSRGYGNLSPIHSRITGLPLKKYMIFIALVIAPFLVVTYSINKYLEIQKKEVQQPTQIQEWQKMKRKKHFVHLTKFNEKNLGSDHDNKLIS